MSQRIEAAAKAIHKYDVNIGLCTRYAPTADHKIEAAVALEASDAVMFDEAAVERAAGVLEDADVQGPLTAPEIVRAVIAALKGDSK